MCSTSLKFSQHAVFHIPGAAFRNNIAAGRFVQHVHRQLKADIESHNDGKESEHFTDTASAAAGSGRLSGLSRDDLQQLFVKRRSGELTSYCDLGVYTRNRNFRLILSTKLGKASGELRVARENQFLSEPSITDGPTAKRSRLRQRVDSDHHSEMEQTFLDSLVCNVQFNNDMQILDFDADPCEYRSARQCPSESYGHAESGTCTSSPFPNIDQFVTSAVRSLGSKGSGAIWRWAYFSSGQLLVYDIVHNRWCANVQREHRSNNIIIVVDLHRGVYYQKCYDPECRAINFKSPEYQLPSSLMDQVHGAGGEAGEVTDDDLLRAVMEMEQTLDDSDELPDGDLLSAVIDAEDHC